MINFYAIIRISDHAVFFIFLYKIRLTAKGQLTDKNYNKHYEL